MKRFIFLIALVLASVSASAGTVVLRNPSYQTVDSCGLDCSAVTSCSFNYNIACTQTGWFTATSPDCINNCPPGGCNVYECQCVDGTCFNTKWCVKGRGVVQQDADGDGADDRCESFPADPCSISVSLDNCNNAIGTGCPGCLRGTVRNSSAPLQGAEVTVIGKSSAVTDSSGNYLMAPINPGLYSLSATKSPYSPTVLYSQQVFANQITTINFELGYGPSPCEQDCTYASDNICHPECAGTNGCSFYSQQAMSVCSNQASGFRLPYGGGQEIQCCEGTPYPPAKVKATTEINSSNVVRIVKVALYEGRLVKIVIDVFD